METVKEYGLTFIIQPLSQDEGYLKDSYKVSVENTPFWIVFNGMFGMTPRQIVYRAYKQFVQMSWAGGKYRMKANPY